MTALSGAQPLSGTKLIRKVLPREIVNAGCASLTISSCDRPLAIGMPPGKSRPIRAKNCSRRNNERHSYMNFPFDLRQLRAFSVLTRSGSFTQTARELHLTQSAVCHSMKALERETGCRLLDRLGKKPILTQANEQLLRVIVPIVALDKFLQLLPIANRADLLDRRLLRAFLLRADDDDVTALSHEHAPVLRQLAIQKESIY
jgi:hypothetical protein